METVLESKMIGIAIITLVLSLTLETIHGSNLIGADIGESRRVLEAAGDSDGSKMELTGTSTTPANNPSPLPSKWTVLGSLRGLFSDLYHGVKESISTTSAGINGERVKRSALPANATGGSKNPTGVTSRKTSYRIRGIRSFPYILPHPIMRSYYGRRYSIPRLVPLRSESDFLSRRSFPSLESREWYQPETTAKTKKVKKNNVYKIRPVKTSETNPLSRSVRMFKRLKKKLRGKKKFPAREFDSDSIGVAETMKVQTNNDSVHIAKSQYRCKTGTNAVLETEEGRKVGSKSVAFSEDDGHVKSLLCRTETSEVSKPNDDIIVRNSVTGLNVITTDHDPLKFLDRDGDVNHEFLEIGSKAISTLETGSIKNQSVSSVGTHDKGTDSLAKANTKFVYDKTTGMRTAIESMSQAEGTARFDLAEGNSPLVLTSKQEELSAIFRNPNMYMKEDLQLDDDGDIATFMNYKKNTDFDVAFRSGFDC